MMGSESQASSGASANRAQQSIDPSQIQQVFGTDAAVVDLSSLDADDVRQLQTTLQERGHYRGNVDGIVGPQTRAALNAVLAEQYALNQRLINQGQVTEQLVSSLGVDAQGIAPVSGVDDPMDAERQPAQRPSQPRNSGTSSSPGSSQPSGFSSSSPSGSSGANGSSGAPSPTSPPPAPR
jgi:lysozyme family protein